MPVQLPCGQCIGCRLEKSRQWAMRAVHEAEMYEENCFVTLTYDDEHLPKHGFLQYADPVDWMKRLRERDREKREQKGEEKRSIRSYGCAEYGEKYGRPHYHVCLFNYDFEDKIFYKRVEDFDTWTSEIGRELWPHGHCVIGSLTFESAAYVARYCTKKITGKLAEKHYEFLDETNGEILQRPPERAICVSRRPGLGKPWLDTFHKDVFSFDEVILRGKRMQPPKYYDRRSEKDFPTEFKRIRAERRWDARFELPLTDTERRLDVKERCAELKAIQLKRHYEGEENA